MKSFYKKWLEKNKKENEEVASSNVTSAPKHTQPEQSKARKTQSKVTPNDTNIVLPSTSIQNVDTNIVRPSTSIQNIPATQTDIIFENDDLKMVIEKGAFQRQKRFRFQDHLFFVKILLKNNDQTVPFLRDILEFIEVGLLHLMKTIKQFYKEEDENICYLTLHQNPMVIGLNSGVQFKTIS